MNKQILSLAGWNSEILRKGDIVLFKVWHASKGKYTLHAGRVVKGYGVEEEDEIEGNWRVEDLISGNEYYPYASNVCKLERGGNPVMGVEATLVETPKPHKFTSREE